MDLFKSITHPDEVLALLKFKIGGCEAVMPKCNFASMSPTLQKCYEYLKKTSRSFAAVIQALDGELRDAICIFYLVLRALDTVEDDMTITNTIKVPMLKEFYTYLQDPEWKFMDSNEKDKLVLEDFPTISFEFRQLAPIYQDVISDICHKMGVGMTVFLEGKIGSTEEWDEYCHYVAGLVGIGLSRIFSASELEDPIVGEDTELANSMGLFLQKTNIIRDYLEDINDKREFWPRATWSKYASTLAELKLSQNRQKAVACMNELITNALHHIPDVITYMSRIKNQSVFNFCAIPQVMAIGTLERCYNNPCVFTGVVKIRKGEAVRMMMESTHLDSMKAIMNHFTQQINLRIHDSDPSAKTTRSIVNRCLSLTETSHQYNTSSPYFPLYMSFAMTIGAISWHYWNFINTVFNTYSVTGDEQ